MSRSEGDERFSEDLREVAALLRQRRPALGPLELDRIKLDAIRGARASTSSRGRGFSMRSRLVALLTVGMLILGTGSAMAGFFDFGGGFSGFFDNDNAAFHQYKFHPPCKTGWYFGYDDKCHIGPPGHYWHFIHGWCWIPDGNGGFTWGFGNGWVYQ